MAERDVFNCEDPSNCTILPNSSRINRIYDERFREPEASTYAFGTNKRVIRSYTVGVIPPDEQIILLTKLVRERQVIQFLLKSTFSKTFEDFREHANQLSPLAMWTQATIQGMANRCEFAKRGS